jgi:hypothetical protein
MNELTFRRMFLELDDLDSVKFDLFATQFTDSLEQLGGDPPYWHGRLIGYGATDTPYRINFAGEDLSEQEFRNKLDAKEIDIEKFDLVGKVSYDPDAAAPATALEPHTVEYIATIKAIINGEEIARNVRVKHRIRKSFLAYETEISFI